MVACPHTYGVAMASLELIQQTLNEVVAHERDVLSSLPRATRVLMEDLLQHAGGPISQGATVVVQNKTWELYDQLEVAFQCLLAMRDKLQGAVDGQVSDGLRVPLQRYALQLLEEGQKQVDEVQSAVERARGAVELYLACVERRTEGGKHTHPEGQGIVRGCPECEATLAHMLE